jgi:hypothetical protein
MDPKDVDVGRDLLIPLAEALRKRSEAQKG